MRREAKLKVINLIKTAVVLNNKTDKIDMKVNSASFILLKSFIKQKPQVVLCFNLMKISSQPDKIILTFNKKLHNTSFTIRKT